MQIDAFLFQYINGLVNQSKFLDIIAVFFAGYLQYGLGLILVVFLFFPKKDRLKNRTMVVIGLLAAFFSRFIVKTAIVLFYSRPRPFLILPEARKLLSVSLNENFQSFPSGHAIFFFSLSAVLYCFNKKLGSWFFAASVVMVGARVFTGLHWLSDVLVGAVLGALVGWLAFRCYRRWREPIDGFLQKFL